MELGLTAVLMGVLARGAPEDRSGQGGWRSEERRVRLPRRKQGPGEEEAAGQRAESIPPFSSKLLS